MPDCNDQDSRSTARVTALTSAWSFGTRHFDDDAKTGIRRELEAVHKAAGASLRSAVKPATCITCKDERAGAATIVGCGAASAQVGV